MKNIVFMFLVAILLFGINAGTHAQHVFEKNTYQFAVRENQNMFLDRYSPVGNEEKTPCIIFVFGGAFARGTRDAEKYVPYFSYLVENGYTVVSIDYRLGLKNIGEEKGLNEEKFVGIFQNTLDMAVEDLFDATNFLLEHAGEWNIDTDCIVANGSSAGAVTVLQAAHAISNGTYSSASKLPAGFNYSGVISFAGAIFTLQDGIKWNNTPCPLMLMHGDADLQVPYDNLKYGDMGFYGPATIVRTLDENNYPYYFCKYENYGHEIASDVPMNNNREDVLWFLDRFVKEKQQLQVVKEQKQIGKPEKEKDFGFEDYIRGNFAR